jgi:putative redox protein
VLIFVLWKLNCFIRVQINNNNENYIKQSKRKLPFRIKNERGHIVNVDNRSEFGGDDLGASPMELVLMGVADAALSIWFHSKEAATRDCSFKAEVEGERVQVEAKPFKDIHVVFI